MKKLATLMIGAALVLGTTAVAQTPAPTKADTAKKAPKKADTAKKAPKKADTAKK